MSGPVGARPWYTPMLLWAGCFGQAVRRDLQFRSQTFLNGLSSIADLVLSLMPVLILMSNAGAAAGWSGPMAMAIVGLFGVCSGLIDTFVAPNMRRIDTYIRRGDLDLILVRPVSAALFTGLRWMEPAELGRVATGLCLLLVSLTESGLHPSPTTVLAAGTWAFLGMVAYSLFWANLAYLAFWIDSAEPVGETALQLREAGKYPLAYFPRPVRFLLRTFIPAGLLAAVPVETLTRRGEELSITLIGLVLLAGLTALHWRAGLRRYDGASS